MPNISKGQAVFFASLAYPTPDAKEEKVLVEQREVLQAGPNRIRVAGRGDFAPSQVDTTARAAVEREHRASMARVRSLASRLDQAKKERAMFEEWLAANPE